VPAAPRRVCGPGADAVPSDHGGAAADGGPAGLRDTGGMQDVDSPSPLDPSTYDNPWVLLALAAAVLLALVTVLVMSRRR
jgi:hypothetical protein